MAVDDTWFLSKRGPDKERVKSAKHGRGKRYRVRYTDDTGAPKEQMFERKADADRFDANVRADLSRGQYIDPAAGKLTFETYSRRWLSNQVHADTTALQVATHMRGHIWPRIGERELRAVRASDIQGLVRHLTATLAPATVEVIYRYVSAVFRAAVLDRLIATTPCVRITLPKIEPARVKPLPLVAVDALRAATHPQYRALVDIGMAAGLRQGEAFGLEVEHVDFLRRTVRVEQQLKLLPGAAPFLAPPKTEKSRRTVPIGRVLVERLAAHLAEFPAVEVEVVDRTGPHPVTRMAKLLTSTVENAPIRRTRYSERVWIPARKAAQAALVKAAGTDPGALAVARTAAAELDEATFHDLRHFYASVLIAHGASVTQVQHRLGHSSATETLKTYSHLWPDEDDRTRDILDAVLAGKPGPLRAVG